MSPHKLVFALLSLSDVACAFVPLRTQSALLQGKTSGLAAADGDDTTVAAAAPAEAAAPAAAAPPAKKPAPAADGDKPAPKMAPDATDAPAKKAPPKKAPPPPKKEAPHPYYAWDKQYGYKASAGAGTERRGAFETRRALFGADRGDAAGRDVDIPKGRAAGYRAGASGCRAGSGLLLQGAVAV